VGFPASSEPRLRGQMDHAVKLLIGEERSHPFTVG
jgi:hypothetical protein